MSNAWWNFLNKQNYDTNLTSWIILLILPVVCLMLIFCFRRPISRIEKRYKRFILGTLGGIILSFEVAQDITKLIVRIFDASFANGDVAAGFKGNTLEILELCRVNMILLGLFLIFNKLNWVKYIAAAALFGGISTIFSKADVHAKTYIIWGAAKHAFILPVIPALALTMQHKKYTLKELGIAHLVNYVYVGIAIAINYTVPMHDGSMTRSIGNLNEITLGKDNPITDWAPYGSRIFIYVFVVTITFWIWWGAESLIRKYTNYNRPINYLWSRKQA